MREVTARQLAKAAGGVLILGDPDCLIDHISLDSRNMEGRDLFVPIIGEKVDAHRFICQALAGGAKAVFTNHHQNREQAEEAIREQCSGHEDWRPAAEQAAWIAVADTKEALQAFGACSRWCNPIPLVGITGSVGKTTTREMIAAALGSGYTVYKTPGNSNSQVGVPITVAEIPEEAEIGVIELGVSEPGEMAKIANVAQVNCAVVTNIGIAHIEQLGSREHIMEEKLHILDGMSPDGALILNGDDDLLKTYVSADGRRVIFYGMGENCDYRAEELHLVEGYPVFTAVHDGERTEVRLRVMGEHMVLNALAALAAAGEYGLSMKQAASGLELFEGFAGRQQIYRTGDITIIDDSYNASPVSMKAGIRVLRAMPTKGRRIAVLADMKELGAEAVPAHREIGAFLKEEPVDVLVLYGELVAEIKNGLEEAGGSIMSVYCENLDQIRQWLDVNVTTGDSILFKGSNSMRLSEAAAFLKQQLSNR